MFQMTEGTAGKGRVVPESAQSAGIRCFIRLDSLLNRHFLLPVLEAGSLRSRYLSIQFLVRALFLACRNHKFWGVVFFCLFRATLAAYGGSQARGLIGAVATGPHHSHSNVGSEPRLQPTPQLTATLIPNPLSEARDRTRNLMFPSRIRFCCATMGTPVCLFFKGTLDGQG